MTDSKPNNVINYLFDPNRLDSLHLAHYLNPDELKKEGGILNSVVTKSDGNVPIFYYQKRNLFYLTPIGDTQWNFYSHHMENFLISINSLIERKCQLLDRNFYYVGVIYFNYNMIILYSGSALSLATNNNIIPHSDILKNSHLDLNQMKIISDDDQGLFISESILEDNLTAPFRFKQYGFIEKSGKIISINSVSIADFLFFLLTSSVNKKCINGVIKTFEKSYQRITIDIFNNFSREMKTFLPDLETTEFAESVDLYTPLITLSQQNFFRSMMFYDKTHFEKKYPQMISELKFEFKSFPPEDDFSGRLKWIEKFIWDIKKDLLTEIMTVYYHYQNFPSELNELKESMKNVKNVGYFKLIDHIHKQHLQTKEKITYDTLKEMLIPKNSFSIYENQLSDLYYSIICRGETIDNAYQCYIKSRVQDIKPRFPTKKITFPFKVYYPRLLFMEFILKSDPMRININTAIIGNFNNNNF